MGSWCLYSRLVQDKSRERRRRCHPVDAHVLGVCGEVGRKLQFAGVRVDAGARHPEPPRHARSIGKEVAERVC